MADKTTMTIHLYAILKEYFPAKIILLENSVDDIDALKKHLLILNPDSQSILDACRFAVNNKIVQLDQSLKATDEISVIPPSSGG